MMFKVESFATKVKCNLRVIVLISFHEKECLTHMSQWTKPLNKSTVSKIHIGTAKESYLQRSSFDSVHFLEFYFFFFANRYGMVERCSLSPSSVIIVVKTIRGSIVSFLQIDTGWESV